MASQHKALFPVPSLAGSLLRRWAGRGCTKWSAFRPESPGPSTPQTSSHAQRLQLIRSHLISRHSHLILFQIISSHTISYHLISWLTRHPLPQTYTHYSHLHAYIQVSKYGH